MNEARKYLLFGGLLGWALTVMLAVAATTR